MKIFQRLTLVMLLAVALGSCHVDDDDILGRWESRYYCDGYDEIELYESERCYYTFYNDGTGIYSQWDDIRRQYYNTDFYWDEPTRGHLVLRHSDGLVEDFYYRFRRGDMEASSDRTFRTYYVFVYTGRYYN